MCVIAYLYGYSLVACRAGIPLLRNVPMPDLDHTLSGPIHAYAHNPTGPAFQ